MNVLPIHFEVEVPSYDQFLHLLAIWGFDTVNDPRYPFVNVYKHAMFQEGDWEGCLQMKLPDLNDQQVMSQAQAGADEKIKNISRKGPSPEHSASSAAPKVVVAANNYLSLGRSVTLSLNEKPESDTATTTQQTSPTNACKAAFLELAVTQTNIHQQHSNLGPVFSSKKENLIRRSTLDAYTGGNLMSSSSSIIINDSILRRMEQRHFSHGQEKPVQGQMLNTNTTPSDAAVLLATGGIVSAAMDALRPISRKHTIDHVYTNGNVTSRLDAMTTAFLQRSMTKLSRRPTSIIGPRPCLSAVPRQFRSILMQQQPFLRVKDGMNIAISRQMLAASVDTELEVYIKACRAHQSDQQTHKASILSNLSSAQDVALFRAEHYPAVCSSRSESS